MRRLAWLLLGGLAGCLYLRPAFDPAPWDAYGDRGVMRVRGTPRTSPGHVIFDSLARDPSLHALLGREGEPDTVEVLGGRYAPKQMILRYERRDRVRRIIVDATSDGLVARVPEPATLARGAPRRSGTTHARMAPTPCTDCAPPSSKPSVAQSLECPIDPGRSDCRALCTADASHEWCARP